MERVIVKTPLKKYPILFCEDFSNLKQAVEDSGLCGRRLLVITDSNVLPMYLDGVKEALDGAFSQIIPFPFEAGEGSKNLDTISRIYQCLIENHFDRKDVIAALGGGVCGDMAGFAAATFLRGIRFIQIPTTLLAQVDSSVGGKTGVDFFGAKNMIGAFYQPELVYINSQTVKSLPEREFAAGMAEVIKYGYIVSQSFLETIYNNRQKILDRDNEVLLHMIAQCCRFKAAVVCEDEKEQGRREILNFGHTIGHGIEALLQFQLLHGECVALGMIGALSICVKKGLLPEETLNQAKELLAFFRLPVKTKEPLDSDAVLEKMTMDKKVKDNKISFILLHAIGEAYSTTEVSNEEMKQALCALQ